MNPTFALVRQDEANVCPACKRVVRSWTVHRRSSRCRDEANRELQRRMDLAEVFWGYAKLIRSAAIPIVKMRATKNGRRVTRHYAPRWAATLIHRMAAAGYTDERMVAVLRSPPPELERERVVLGLQFVGRSPKVPW